MFATRITRAHRRIAGAGLAAAAAVATLAVAAAPAQADTLPSSVSPVIGSYSIPQHAPGYVAGNTLLPTTPGALGNPAQLVMTGSSGLIPQAIGVSGDSWGSQVQTQDAKQGAAAQTFYYQLIGTVRLNLVYSDATVPVYKILHYGSQGVTCLDGFGGNPTSGTVVDTYGCDVNSVNQLNQLWLFESPSQLVPSYYPSKVAGALSASLAQTTATWSQYVAENLAAVLSSGADTTTSPVLSAGTTNLDGYHAGLALQDQEWPTTNANSTWGIADAVIPPNSNTNPGPGCTGIGCLFDTY